MSAPAGQRERALHALLEGAGIYTTERYELLAQRPQVHVRDLKTGVLVAYSATNADFEDAVHEFVRDYV